MRRTLVAGVLAGCATGQGGSVTMVSTAQIAGAQLVVTRCEVHLEGERLVVGVCFDTHQTLPVIQHEVCAREAAPVAPDAVERRDVARGLAAIHDALAACAHPVALRVQLAIDHAGAAAVTPDTTDTALASCVRGAFATTLFEGAARGASLAVTLAPTGTVAP